MGTYDDAYYEIVDQQTNIESLEELKWIHLSCLDLVFARALQCRIDELSIQNSKIV